MRIWFVVSLHLVLFILWKYFGLICMNQFFIAIFFHFRVQSDLEPNQIESIYRIWRTILGACQSWRRGPFCVHNGKRGIRKAYWQNWLQKIGFNFKETRQQINFRILTVVETSCRIRQAIVKFITSGFDSWRS